jgi:hypothetical protein
MKGTPLKAMAVIVVGTVLMASGCSTSSKIGARSARAPTALSSPRGTPMPAANSPSAATSTRDKASVAGIPSPRPLKLPARPNGKVDAKVSVQPECVNPGGEMSMEIQTSPGAHLAFQPVYSDNNSGAPAPAGAGYGGDGKGISDPSGRFTWSWVVSQSAPAGRARMDVFSVDSDGWTYAFAFFTVRKGEVTC